MSSSQLAEIGLGHTILRRASLTPDARALTFEGQTWTCAELGDRVRRLATILRAISLPTDELCRPTRHRSKFVPQK